ncbi:MAG: hypothetical protein LBB88_07200 [Planctomycetaceae bacterium]|nr:hypothetical protein [Planctomycetaceae bacterium]
MILIIVESFLSLPSATRPFGERLRTYGRLPDLLTPPHTNLITSLFVYVFNEVMRFVWGASLATEVVKQ